MNLSLKAFTIVFLGTFASFSNASDNEETKASRFLYCANVSQFYYQYFFEA